MFSVDVSKIFCYLSRFLRLEGSQEHKPTKYINYIHDVLVCYSTHCDRHALHVNQTYLIEFLHFTCFYRAKWSLVLEKRPYFLSFFYHMEVFLNKTSR